MSLSISKNKKKLALVGILPVALLMGVASPAAPGAMAAGTNLPNVDYTFAVNSGGDTHDAVLGNHICADSTGACTLRAAIEEAFSSPNLTTINVNVTTVTLSASLGTINWAASNTRVNGNLATVTGVNMSGTQDIIAISGNGNTLDDIVLRRSRQDGVRIGDFAGVGAGNNNTISNAVIVGNARFGVYISGGSGGGGQNNRVTSTNVGITRSATSCVAADANPYGIFVTAGARSTMIDNNNVACSVIDGISVTGGGTTNTLVDQNRVGVKGNVAVGNGFDGVSTYGGATNTTISRNTISGNHEYGVYVSDATTQNVVLSNNVIGASIDGTTYVPNDEGVRLQNTNVQFLTTNFILGNASVGVHITGNSTGNGVTGNYITHNGLYGVKLDAGANGNSIGGSRSTGQGNTISDSGYDGVFIRDNATTGNFVYGNQIGVDANGTGALPNAGNGVTMVFNAHDNHIGSATNTDYRNIISGNGFQGVQIGIDTFDQADHNYVEGNYIGTNLAGSAAIANHYDGIGLTGVANTVIRGNLVSGNSHNGINLAGTNATTIDELNYIGVGADLSTALGNGQAGIIINGSTNTLVHAGKVNNNGGAGIALTGDNTTLNNALLPFEVRNNGGLPIDLNNDGPTNNDPGDTDSGPNTLLNYPVITGSSGSNLSGTTCANCEVYIYEAVGNPRASGGGGVLRYRTLADGTGNWSAALPSGLNRYNVTLVACDGPCRSLAGNTSEMSPLDTPPATPTSTPTASNTPGSSATATQVSATATRGSATTTATQVSATATTTATQVSATATATVCLIQFADVPSSNTFYPYARCLACKGILSGYPCGGTNPEGGAAEPCDPTFKPYFRYNNAITRGQISKIVANAAGFNESAGSRLFEDVPESSPFYAFVNRLVNRGVMSGYACGSRIDEPCVLPANRPYFRPQTNASRGQLSKIVSNAAGFSEAHTEQTFQDVDTASPFYAFIQRLVSRNVMSGYPCGGAGESCVPPANRGYFRPNSTVTRGQAAKIVANALLPNCQVSARP